jgi:hypothetical protein
VLSRRPFQKHRFRRWDDLGNELAGYIHLPARATISDHIEKAMSARKPPTAEDEPPGHKRQSKAGN